MAWDIGALTEQLLIGSTLVEGSTLTESEARAVLAGRTVQGHPITEARELTNYQWATEWLAGRFGESPWLSLDLLLGYHERLMQGLREDAGRFKAHANFTLRSDGARFDYEHPGRVAQRISEWIVQFNTPAPDPVGMAAALYASFEAIHPFSDGNGRVGRVLIAYFLHREAAAAFRFYLSDKLEHLRATEASDAGNLEPLIEFIRARIAT